MGSLWNSFSIVKLKLDKVAKDGFYMKRFIVFGIVYCGMNKILKVRCLCGSVRIMLG